MRFVRKTISGWGHFPKHDARLYRPHRMDDLRTLVGGQHDGGCLARGLGRSYGDAALNEGGAVILQDKMNRMRSFDAVSGLLECEGGVSLSEIIETFLPRGYFLPVTPGTRFVTVGGAIASDVHGKNHHQDGCFSNFVETLTLMTPGGRLIQCSPNREPEVFWATVGGMGLTGVIVDATLRLIPVETGYIQVDYQRTANLDETFEKLEAADQSFPYSVAWVDGLSSGRNLGRSVLMCGHHASGAELPANMKGDPLELKPPRAKLVPFMMPGWVLNRLSIRLLNGVYYTRHRTRRKLERYDTFFYPLDAIGHWNRMYGAAGFLQYQMVLPPQSGRDGVREALELLARSGMPAFLIVLKRFGAAGQGLLSFPQPGYTLTLDLPNRGAKLLEACQKLDQLVLKHNGRVYLAKDATLTPESFRAMYPQADRFLSIKEQLDPDGLLTSSLARRVGLMDR